MKKLFAGLLGLQYLCISEALAAGAQAHSPAPLSSLNWPAVNFTLFVLLMVYLYKKLAKPKILAHVVEVEQALQKTARVFEEADRELCAAQARLKSILDEQKEIEHRLATEGAQLAAEIMDSAEKSVVQIRGDIAKKITQKQRAASDEVRALVLKRATDLARKQLASGVSAEDDLKLRQEAIRNIL